MSADLAPPVPAPPTARLSDAPLCEDEVLAPWPGHLVEVDGVELNVRVTPATDAAAEPALFVHGLGGSSQNWTELAGLLRDRLAIEALDLPGFGRSGPSRQGYSLERQARLVVDYLVQSGRGPVHLVGNSMGGAISLQVAALRPDLIRTLTLISPAVPDLKRVRIHPLKFDPLLGLVVVPGVAALALKRLRTVAPEVRAKMTLKLCFADVSRFPERRLQEAVDETEYRRRFPWADRAMIRSTRAIAWSQLIRGREGWRSMRTLDLPALVVWGDTDRLVAPDLAAHVAHALPHGRLLYMDHIGHTAQMEDPRTTARAIRALLDDAAGADEAGVTQDSGPAVAT